jgi:Ca2+-binding RTX toxin-like protein
VGYSSLRSTGGKETRAVIRSARRTVLLFTVAGMTVLLSSATVAFAQIVVGTNNSETLTGTNSDDHITGKGGNDTLQGKARNDVYHFDDGFGEDTLVETAFVKVGKKKLPGGTDTLSFSQYSGDLNIHIAPQASGADNLSWNAVYEQGGFTRLVTLGFSPVENVVGGSGSDNISGGSARNTYKGGPGGDDTFIDYGGASSNTFIPNPQAPSDDTYKGFTAGTGGNDSIADWGGTGDVLDLRPLESSDVYFDAFDNDGNNANDSLRMVISSNATSVTTSVTVIGHFAPVLLDQDNGRMEQIIFSDGVVTSAASML